MAISRLCSIPDCGKQSLAFGFCRTHYNRFKRHGDPLGGQTFRGAPKKFIDDVVAAETREDCIIWPFCRTADGYASINYNGRTTLASRIVCQIVNGPRPNKHEAAHSCGNGKHGCVNPKHLRWATPQENSADKLIHGTHNRGENCGMSKLTGEAVSKIRDALATGIAINDLAERYHVSPRTIRHIRDGDRWSYRGAS